MNTPKFLQPIYLIDNLNTLLRMYYGMPQNLTDTAGNPTQAIYGYLKQLKTIEEHSLMNYNTLPAIIVCDDAKGPTFRNELYDKYKANRPSSGERPEDFYGQKEIIRDIFISSGLTTLSVEKYEADDIIATIMRKYSEKGHDVYIISSDKDLSQLITNYHTFILDGIKKITWHKNNIFSRFNVPAEKIVDYLSLVGDQADNIPGVPGIGKVGAEKIINNMGSIEEIYDIIDNDEDRLEELLNNKTITKGNIKKLLEGREEAFFSKKLIELYDVPLELKDISEYVFSTSQISKEILSVLNIKSL